MLTVGQKYFPADPMWITVGTEALSWTGDYANNKISPNWLEIDDIHIYRLEESTPSEHMHTSGVTASLVSPTAISSRSSPTVLRTSHSRAPLHDVPKLQSISPTTLFIFPIARSLTDL
jgi:hypothetical protein